jgi:hypothetical protein
MGLARSRTASKIRSVAAGTRFRASGLIKGLRGLAWFRSRLGDDESLTVFGAGSAVGSGGGSGWGT